MENKITISMETFEELIRAHERLFALKRLLEANTYVNPAEVMAVLGIKKSKGEEK